jgi:hypothetical protein
MMTCRTASPATSPAAESVLPGWSLSALCMMCVATLRPADVPSLSKPPRSTHRPKMTRARC